jgi:hypothetical protein
VAAGVMISSSVPVTLFVPQLLRIRDFIGSLLALFCDVNFRAMSHIYLQLQAYPDQHTYVPPR